MSQDFEDLPCNELDQLLRKFYAEIRNSDGEHYGKSSFVGIRASISRHLKNPPHNKAFALMGNPDFHKSNQMFTAMLKLLKKDGLDKTSHYQPISENDLKLLKSSGILSNENPKSLQRKVWFDITLNFARRGRENFRSLTKESFVFSYDDAQVEFCEMAYNESTKNHQGDNLKDIDSGINPRMYANESESCPIKSLKLYLSKLSPDSSYLFQQAKRSVSKVDPIWYTSRPVGIRILNDMMKQISVDAGLSKTYTNHCVRATAITLLAHAGVETREIMKISGHRNEASVRSYNSDSSAGQKRLYSSILQGFTPPHPLGQTHSSTMQIQPVRSSGSFFQTETYQTTSVSSSNATNSTCINQRILQMPPFHTGYEKQFEISHSVVHVHNYGN